MYLIHTAREPFTRHLTIISVAITGPLDDPLDGLSRAQRFDICRRPLSRDERQLLRASKLLPADQQRAVLHHLLADRRASFEREFKQRVHDAVIARRQDEINHDNMRTRRHGDYLRRSANRKHLRQGQDQEQDQEQAQ